MFKPLALAAAVLTAFSFNAFAAKTELTVYTALEAEQLKTYKQAFEKANPDVEIKWVRDSTGIITAKLLAEKARPQADAVWGLAASSLAILDLMLPGLDGLQVCRLLRADSATLPILMLTARGTR